jgi:hypothetical protein
MAEKEGVLIRHLHPKVISPLPDRQIRYFLAELRHVLIVEEISRASSPTSSGKFGIVIRCTSARSADHVPEVYASIMKVARI